MYTENPQMEREKITIRKIQTPLSEEQILTLRAGDKVILIRNNLYGSDAAHQRMIESIKRGEALPFLCSRAIPYYAGPTPAKRRKSDWLYRPTTSCRMDG